MFKDIISEAEAVIKNYGRILDSQPEEPEEKQARILKEAEGTVADAFEQAEGSTSFVKMRSRRRLRGRR